MNHVDSFLKVLYDNNNLEDFISLVEPSSIEDSRTRAIIAALKRSVQVLELEFNPINISEPPQKIKSTTS